MLYHETPWMQIIYVIMTYLHIYSSSARKLCSWHLFSCKAESNYFVCAARALLRGSFRRPADVQYLSKKISAYNQKGWLSRIQILIPLQNSISTERFRELVKKSLIFQNCFTNNTTTFFFFKIKVMD